MDDRQRRKCLESATRPQLVELSSRYNSAWPMWKPKWTTAMLIDRLMDAADRPFTAYGFVSSTKDVTSCQAGH